MLNIYYMHPVHLITHTLQCNTVHANFWVPRLHTHTTLLVLFSFQHQSVSAFEVTSRYLTSPAVTTLM